jgi:hypothetical protein
MLRAVPNGRQCRFKFPLFNALLAIVMPSHIQQLAPCYCNCSSRALTPITTSASEASCRSFCRVTRVSGTTPCDRVTRSMHRTGAGTAVSLLSVLPFLCLHQSALYGLSPSGWKCYRLFVDLKLPAIYRLQSLTWSSRVA